MKKKSASQSAFFNLRILIGLFIVLAGVFLALLGFGAFSSVFAQGKGSQNNSSTTNQASPGTQAPDVIQMVGPVRLDQDLRSLPYVAPKPEFEERVLTRYPHGREQAGAPSSYGTSRSAVARRCTCLLSPVRIARQDSLLKLGLRRDVREAAQILVQTDRTNHLYHVRRLCAGRRLVCSGAIVLAAFS